MSGSRVSSWLVATYVTSWLRVGAPYILTVEMDVEYIVAFSRIASFDQPGWMLGR